jgi:hypothetical protein
MDRRHAIAALAATFASASAAHDWERLGAAAGTLAQQLAALAAHGPWSTAERSALAQLRAAHACAALTCAAEQQALALRLAEMQANKAGWIAYTLDSESEPMGTAA